MPGPITLKVIFFADSHLGFDYPLRPKINIRRRGEDFFKNYHRILAYAEQSRPDFIVHGGDFFFRSRVAQRIVDLAYQPLFDFVNRTDIPVYIVPGNHERSRLPQSIYLAHPQIHVFNRATCFHFAKNDLHLAIHGFPFFRGDIRSHFNNLVQQSGWNESKADISLLVIHQAVDGAQVGPGNYMFRNSKDVINIHDIPTNATAVLSGHIHRRQVLYSRRVPVIYPGSIERTSFAEKDEQKGFYEIEFSVAQSSQWQVRKLKFLRLAARPMFDIYPDGENSLPSIEESLLQKCAALPPDSIVRLRLPRQANPEIIKKISIARIRKLLPGTFNLQIAVEYYRALENQS